MCHAHSTRSAWPTLLQRSLCLNASSILNMPVAAALHVAVLEQSRPTGSFAHLINSFEDLDCCVEEKSRCSQLKLPTPCSVAALRGQIALQSEVRVAEGLEQGPVRRVLHVVADLRQHKRRDSGGNPVPPSIGTHLHTCGLTDVHVSGVRWAEASEADLVLKLPGAVQRCFIVQQGPGYPQELPLSQRPVEAPASSQLAGRHAGWGWERKSAMHVE